MNFIIDVIIGAGSGALAGGAAGCLFAWSWVSGAYTGWRTFWPDCGPHIFIPLWVGTVIGLVARMERDSAYGVFSTIISGAAAGFITPALFWLVFGRNLHFSFGFLSVPMAREIIISAGGGAAGFFWHLGVNKFFR